MASYPFSFTYDMYETVKNSLGRVVTWDNNKQFYLQLRKLQTLTMRGYKLKGIVSIGKTQLLVEMGAVC